ncbi:MAG: TauD/TfdA family dioxygenase [Candidatus Competibacterales bacterium]
MTPTSPGRLRLESQPLGLWYAATDAETAVELDPLWLREHCQDPDHLDPRTRQRLFDPHQLPANLALTAAHWEDPDTLWLAFSDGYGGRYAVAELLFDAAGGDGCPTPEPWRVAHWSTPEAGFRFAWPDLASPEALGTCVEHFLRWGFVVIGDTTPEPQTILELARRFGNVRETNFGQLFEVYSRADGNDLAYRAVALGPHTDNPYREPVPGIQLLHCLVNQAEGGLSTLADGLAAAQALAAEDPAGFELLAETPVRFRFIDRDQYLLEWRPLIQRDVTGQVVGIHYSPRLDALPRLASRDQRQHFHRARQRLGQLLTDPTFELCFKLDPGELLMFDNVRLLHGRTAFDPRTGHRHLQGCYIDRDGPRSLYRVLTRG